VKRSFLPFIGELKWRQFVICIVIGCAQAANESMEGTQANLHPKRREIEILDGEHPGT